MMERKGSKTGRITAAGSTIKINVTHQRVSSTIGALIVGDGITVSLIVSRGWQRNVRMVVTQVVVAAHHQIQKISNTSANSSNSTKLY